MFDEIASLQCTDCNSAVTVAFALLYKKARGPYQLVLLGRCLWCLKRGDKRTLRATVSLPVSMVITASRDGLPVMEVT